MLTFRTHTLKSFAKTGFFFTLILGTLLHFTYEFSQQNRLVALFSAVNESTWEHTKLVFFPMLFFSFYEFDRLRTKVPCFLNAKSAGMISAILAMITMFYTYIGCFGTSAGWVNILIFILSAAFGYFVTYLIISKKKQCLLPEKTGLILIAFLVFIYVYFTWCPPSIPLFQPIAIYGKYCFR